MKRQFFGTDGVRGEYGSALMNEALAWRLGAGAARLAKTRPGLKATRVFIGRDTRASGVALEHALSAGLLAEGLQPVSLGIVPTPAVSLLTRREGAAFGVVITASHNPARDNGIKFFGANGIKLTDEDEARLEMLMPAEAGLAPSQRPLQADGLKHYLEATTALLPENSLAGWKVVLDAAHGAAWRSSRTVLEKLGADLSLIGTEPDGANINAGVGSQHPEAMCARVKQTGARLGIAHDGDADRCVLCDEHGDVLDGDELLAILALHALRQGQLVTNTLVATVQSNLGLDAAVTAAGGRVVRTAVGDRYVIERMLADGATLGGESSGHVICAEVSPTGDGLVAALKIIEVMLATGRPLSELRRGMKKFPQLSAALAVQEKKTLETLPTLNATMAALAAELGARGRVLVRYSGTEPKLRLLVEGETDAQVKRCLDRLLAAARADLAVIGD
ncbi:MAG: phosphoglucosamine mutase [Opitutae bacterium]|nr:phosphoglucosamine mutase [Opitutae bacterium]